MLYSMASRRPQPMAHCTCARCRSFCRDQARLEGARLMARTAAHRLNNTLALVVGYTDLLAQHPAVRARPHLATFAQAALESSMWAAGELSRMQRLVRLVEDSSLV